MPEVFAVFVIVPIALLVLAVLAYIGGFIMSMLAVMVYQPIHYIETHPLHIGHHHGLPA